MRVYMARPRAIEPSHIPDYYWDSGHQSITVIEDDSSRDTGILDARGNPIISCEVIGPVGFGKR